MQEARYSIKDLENFTGIKAHTIRIWEQRYELLTPRRTDTNIRFYLEEDLKKILNINLLYSNGFKISKIAGLDEQEIIQQAKKVIDAEENEFQTIIDELIVATLSFNEPATIEILNKESERMGLITFYEEVLIKFLKKIGELWQVNTIEIIHEHFFSNLLKSFLIDRTMSLKKPINPKGRAILFLHDDEEHEFSLFLQRYVLQSNGYECFYFGQRTPVSEIVEVVNHIKPSIILTAFISKISEKSFVKILDDLLYTSSKSLKVIISGMEAEKHADKVYKEITLIRSASDLAKVI